MSPKRCTVIPAEARSFWLLISLNIFCKIFPNIRFTVSTGKRISRPVAWPQRSQLFRDKFAVVRRVPLRLISITKLLFELWRAFNTFAKSRKALATACSGQFRQALSWDRSRLAGFHSARAGLIAVISPAAASECDLFARVCILIKCPTPLSTLSAFRLALLFITKTFLFMSLFFKH